MWTNEPPPLALWLARRGSESTVLLRGAVVGVDGELAALSGEPPPRGDLRRRAGTRAESQQREGTRGPSGGAILVEAGLGGGRWRRRGGRAGASARLKKVYVRTLAGRALAGAGDGGGAGWRRCGACGDGGVVAPSPDDGAAAAPPTGALNGFCSSRRRMEEAESLSLRGGVI